jgi:hypothetical protein
MSKVKHIEFKVEFEGHGIVNYDSSEQKYIWNRESKEGNKNKFTSMYDNNMYAKKHYSRGEDGVLNYKIKASSETLRNSIFRGDAIAVNPSIVHHKTLLNAFIGSPLGLIRGYLFAENNETFKNKSTLTITSATQTNDAESSMDLNSRSGAKKEKDDSGESDTTIHNKETIGDITYKSKGFINIQELEFLGCDSIFDRYSFNADDFEILKIFLNKNLPNFDSELGYYKLKTSVIDVAEYGIKLNKENVVFLVKEALKRILNISIYRTGAYLKTKKLTIQLVINPLNPKENIDIEINDINDINNLSFEPEENYVLFDENEAKEQRTIIEEAVRIKAEEKKEANKLKAEAKKKFKEESQKNQKMTDRYIKLIFKNAKLFPKNKKTNDYIANVSSTKKGELIFKHSKRSEEEVTSFKEPITVHQVSNMLHTLIGERPVPSFRETFYKPNQYVFNIALNSFLKIDSPKVIRNVYGEEVETLIPEFTKTNKSAWNSWSKPNKLHWFKIEKYLSQYYQEFIEKLNSLLEYNVEKKPFEDLFSIAIDNNKFDEIINWLKEIKKTPLVNLLTKKDFNRSEITKNISSGLGETIKSGVDFAYFLDGEILVPYDENFAKKIIKSSTNILDGGYCGIVGIFYVDEVDNTENFKPISEISDEKY